MADDAIKRFLASGGISARNVKHAFQVQGQGSPFYGPERTLFGIAMDPVETTSPSFSVPSSLFSSKRYSVRSGRG